MGGGVLALDTILSATDFFSTKWSQGIESNKAGRVLRFLLCRLYDEGRGQLVNARLTLAQTTLSKKLGISRQWIGELVGRLERAGWVEHFSPKLPDGTNSSTVFRAGRLLKRLLIMLSKSRRGEKRAKPAAKSRWHFSPTKVEKTLSFTLNKEHEPPSPTTLAQIPTLLRWLERGKERTKGEEGSPTSS
jgi:DNA-binding Lrp family transcriptional regulator